MSPALDNVCDQILGDPPRHHAAAITTAGGIVTALTKVLGSADAAPDLERRLRQPIPSVAGQLRSRSMRTPNAQPVSSLLGPDDRSTASHIAPGRFRRPSAPPTTAQTAAANGRATPTGPPTAARPAASQATASQPSSHPAAPRRWIGLLLVLAVLLIAAGIISALILDRRYLAAPEPKASSDQQSTATSSPRPAQPSKLTIADARDFDPQGDDKTENPDEVKSRLRRRPGHPLAYGAIFRQSETGQPEARRRPCS